MPMPVETVVHWHNCLSLLSLKQAKGCFSVILDADRNWSAIFSFADPVLVFGSSCLRFGFELSCKCLPFQKKQCPSTVLEVMLVQPSGPHLQILRLQGRCPLAAPSTQRTKPCHSRLFQAHREMPIFISVLPPRSSH